MKLRFGLPLALMAALSACQPRPDAMAAPAAADAATVPLSVTTAAGERRFTVEVARTAAEQERGLMYRRSLAPMTGMLFPFAAPRPASFWMRNTPLPLDLVFIRADGTIARIAANAVPESLDLIESGEPVAAVLEIAGGEAARLGIAEGDRVRW